MLFTFILNFQYLRASNPDQAVTLQCRMKGGEKVCCGWRLRYPSSNLLGICVFGWTKMFGDFQISVLLLLLNATLSQQLLSESTPNLTKWLNSLACLLIYLFIYFFFSEYGLGRAKENSEEKLVEIPVVDKVLWCTNLWIPTCPGLCLPRTTKSSKLICERGTTEEKKTFRKCMYVTLHATS